MTKVMRRIINWIINQQFEICFFRIYKWDPDRDFPGVSFILVDFVNYKAGKTVLICWLSISKKIRFSFLCSKKHKLVSA